jgi:4-oxalocrotonate tautomerase
MPMVMIHLIEGRDGERKRRLIREVTDAVVRALDAPEATVRVILNEVPASHWGIGGISKAERDG